MLNNELNTLPCVEQIPPGTPAGSVIWLHGLGANGHDFAGIVPQLYQTNSATPLRFIFPHAPSRPVTINGGYVMPAWYDIVSTSFDQRVDEAGIHASIKQIERLIERENALGIPTEKIVLAGFSQGSVVALLTGLFFSKRIAGILALSGYLPWPEKITPAEQSANKNTPIFIGHGTGDNVVPAFLGKWAYDVLHKQGYQVSWHDYPMQHSVCEQEIEDIDQWLAKAINM